MLLFVVVVVVAVVVVVVVVLFVCRDKPGNGRTMEVFLYFPPPPPPSPPQTSSFENEDGVIGRSHEWQERRRKRLGEGEGGVEGG